MDEFVLDTPVVRAFIADLRAAVARADIPEAAVEAIRPRFAALLADPDWLPRAYREPAPGSGMGGGIGQWFLDTGCVWRHAYDSETGRADPFRSGYANAPCVGED